MEDPANKKLFEKCPTAREDSLTLEKEALADVTNKTTKRKMVNPKKAKRPKIEKENQPKKQKVLFYF